jgi:hypothetical protein
MRICAELKNVPVPAAAFALLALLCAAPPARAQDPSIVCGATGDVTVELGQGLPLPIEFRNPTDFTVTFDIFDQTSDIFNFPPMMTDPRVGTVVMPPHSPPRPIPGHAFPIPSLTPIGTDRVVIDVFGKGKIPPVFRTWGPFRCELNLTVIPPRDFIQVPVRWCIVEGSPQARGVRGPTFSGRFRTLPSPRLIERLALLNDQIYLPHTHIIFRHALAPHGIPIIDDPDGQHIGEQLGDLKIDFRGRNFDAAIFQCEQAWNLIYPDWPGTILINATILDGGAKLGVTPGFSDFDLMAIRPTLCNHPASLKVADLLSIQAVAMQDFETCPSGNCDPDGNSIKTLGHELGHSLALGHGDGLDNNRDGEPAGIRGRRLYDRHCDPLGVNEHDFPLEDVGTTAGSLMDYSAGTTISPLQRETLRAMAKLVPAARFTGVDDPAGLLVAPYRTCDPECGPAADLSLTRAGMAQTPALGATAFWHSVREPQPADTTNEHWTFLDLDDDPATGCDPAALSPGDPGFAGAELVARVSVSTTGGTERATPTVWRCQGGSLVELGDPAITAKVMKPGVTDLRGSTMTQPLTVIVSLHLPDAVRGPAAGQVRLQAIARRVGGEADRLPADGRGGRFSLIPPVLPECTLATPLLPPGGRTRVRASGLTPNRTVDILVGGQAVATGTTGPTGEADIEFALPASSRQGYRPIAVIPRESAESADCVLLVHGGAVTPATVASVLPSPTAGGWNRTDVAVRLTTTDLPGGPGPLDLTFSASGAQPLPATVVANNPATVPLAREGQTDLTFFATNQGGTTEAPQTISIRIDKTPPEVAFAGNRGSYRITEAVDIACAASDSLSGLSREICPDLAAPAYTFDPGANRFVAEVSDLALNQSTATATFTVDVRYDDLCTLGERFGPPHRSLCETLNRAQKAQAAGQGDQKRRWLDSYIDEVKKSVPRVFTQPETDTLVKLATACRAGSC